MKIRHNKSKNKWVVLFRLGNEYIVFYRYKNTCISTINYGFFDDYDTAFKAFKLPLSTLDSISGSYWKYQLM